MTSGRPSLLFWTSLGRAWAWDAHPPASKPRAPDDLRPKAPSCIPKSSCTGTWPHPAWTSTLGEPRELLYSRASASSPSWPNFRSTSRHVLDGGRHGLGPHPFLVAPAPNLAGPGVPAWAECEVTDLQRNTSWSTRRFLALLTASGEGCPGVERARQMGRATRPSHGERHLAAHAALALTQRGDGEAAWLLYHVTPPKSLPLRPTAARVRWDTLTPVNVGQVVADSMIVVQVREGLTPLNWRPTN